MKLGLTNLILSSYSHYLKDMVITLYKEKKWQNIINTLDFAFQPIINSKSFEIYGVGGINMVKSPCSAKCIHLQTATWLGWMRHPASEWLEKNIGELDCNGSCNAICALEQGNIKNAVN